MLKKPRTKNRYTKLFDTDILMKGIWKSLVRDFRAVHGHDYCRQAELYLDSSIREFRDYKWPTRTLAPVFLFKTDYQLENLFKRYRFTNDKFTNEQLSVITLQKFLETQERVARPLHLKEIHFRWIQRARIIISRILGTYDEEELYPLCRFGKRASVGNPARDSYLDLKLYGPITGSLAHTKWFTNYLLNGNDAQLRQIFSDASGAIPCQVSESLRLTNVAKSYKSFRSIMPNTLIGGFRSYGLGKMIERRLKDVGLNIKTLQKRHGFLAQRYSVTRSHVTADLSAASDSFSTELIMRLLPRKWYNALSMGRISQWSYGSKTYYMSSFMTMGIGFTFPLQTLLFYGLLQAAKELLGISGTISVYGDDLIYPRQLHRFVTKCFPALHLQLNVDKTFCRDPFRESCGSDYFRGSDVRPYQPQGESQQLKGRLYILIVYKALNGLLRRWDKNEIPQTYRYLLSEILRVDDTILQVPMRFPDYSGLQTRVVIDDWEFPYEKPTIDLHTWSMKFNYYKLHARERIVLHQYAYYWDSLRKGCSGTGVDNLLTCELSDVSTIQWKTGKPIRFVRCIDGRRRKRLVPTVASKELPSILRQTGSAFSWTEEG